MIIAYAFLLDILVGDPKYFFHPVRIMGKIARFLEKKFNRGENKKFKGMFCALFLIVTFCVLFFYLEKELEKISYGEIILIFLFYTTIAIHDLIKHGFNVYQSLRKKDIFQAREYLSYMVGRDVQNLNEQEIKRGVLESVSENLIDGVTGPIFYAFLFGLPGAFVYKLINTLDSLWGHRSERFKDFGFFAAKVDDVVNFIPARITAPILVFVGSLFTGKLINGVKILLRDRKKHLSPNSAYGQSALAGVLGIQLGGISTYNQKVFQRPYLGDNLVEIKNKHLIYSFLICFFNILLFSVFIFTIK